MNTGLKRRTYRGQIRLTELSAQLQPIVERALAANPSMSLAMLTDLAFANWLGNYDAEAQKIAKLFNETWKPTLSGLRK